MRTLLVAAVLLTLLGAGGASAYRAAVGPASENDQTEIYLRDGEAVAVGEHDGGVVVVIANHNDREMSYVWTVSNDGRSVDRGTTTVERGGFKELGITEADMAGMWVVFEIDGTALQLRWPGVGGK